MVSVCVITRDEALRLRGCLESVRWADEIIVVDDESTDGTAELASRLGARVYVRPLAGDFAAQRNFALEQARGEWVLFVDADERVTPALADEIRRAVTRPGVAGYRVRRCDLTLGHAFRYGESRVTLVRLARREAGRWHGRVHERWDVAGRLGLLREALIHEPHPDIAGFLKKANYQTTLTAERLAEEGRGGAPWQLVTHPLASFVRNYVLRQGFRDGVPGLVFAGLMSLHPFLARAKLLELRETRRAQ